MHMLSTADEGLGLTPTMGRYTIRHVLSHANMAEVSTQGMESNDRDTTRWANIDKIKKLGAGTPRKRCCEAPRRQPLQRCDYKGMHRLGEHETKENMVVSFGQAQGLGIAGRSMVSTTVGGANQIHLQRTKYNDN